MADKVKVVVASRNKHKIREIKDMLSHLSLDIQAVNEVANLPDVIEDGETFSANAIKKAVETARAVGYLTLADDSGLEVDALNGQPGVYSARFAGEPSDDGKNNQRLLDLLAHIPCEQRTARFRCVIALAWPNGDTRICSGTCEGMIGFEPEGDNGFGYDPLFIVPEYNRTFAQLTGSIKNQISHRYRALVQLEKVLAGEFMKKSVDR